MEDSDRAVTIADFSKEAVSKAVAAEKVPGVTAIGLPVGLVGLLGWFVLDPTFIAPVVAVIVMASGFALGLGPLMVNFLFRGKTFERRYIEKLRERMQVERRNVRERVKTELAEIAQEVDGMVPVANQGAAHMNLAKVKNDALQVLLEKKLSQGELTFLRFMGTSEQLYLSILDNVRRIVDHLRTIVSIDPLRIERRIKEIDRIKSQNDDEIRERAALIAQQEERDKQVKLIKKLLRENEEALAQLDRTSSVIASMETGQGREATISLEVAMEEIRSLIKRSSGK
jgi:DNA-binding helix-hairpin-helix protein with protein kinase domain